MADFSPFRFLPLAHVFELLAESVCLLTGVPIGYSTPTTLIDTSTKIKRGCRGDASVLKPTCMTTVPLILDRVSKGINDKVNSQAPLQKAIFKFAYDYKKIWTQRGYETPLLDKYVNCLEFASMAYVRLLYFINWIPYVFCRLIFKKISKLMGGRVRIMLAGGAPLSPDTHEQIKLCLCTEVVQGYGLTETTSGATVMDGKWHHLFLLAFRLGTKY